MPKKSIDAKQVEEFLVLNPDFLSSNSHILDSIEIVHKTGGAVSLIQKQVEVLRKNYESTSGNLLELLEIAKAKDTLEVGMKDIEIKLARLASDERTAAIANGIAKAKNNIDAARNNIERLKAENIELTLMTLMPAIPVSYTHLTLPTIYSV